MTRRSGLLKLRGAPTKAIDVLAVIAFGGASLRGIAEERSTQEDSVDVNGICEGINQVTVRNETRLDGLNTLSNVISDSRRTSRSRSRADLQRSNLTSSLRGQIPPTILEMRETDTTACPTYTEAVEGSARALSLSPPRSRRYRSPPPPYTRHDEAITTRPTRQSVTSSRPTLNQRSPRRHTPPRGTTPSPLTSGALRQAAAGTHLRQMRRDGWPATRRPQARASGRNLNLGEVSDRRALSPVSRPSSELLNFVKRSARPVLHRQNAVMASGFERCVDVSISGLRRGWPKDAYARLSAAEVCAAVDRVTLGVTKLRAFRNVSQEENFYFHPSGERSLHGRVPPTLLENILKADWFQTRHNFRHWIQFNLENQSSWEALTPGLAHMTLGDIAAILPDESENPIYECVVHSLMLGLDPLTLEILYNAYVEDDFVRTQFDHFAESQNSSCPGRLERRDASGVEGDGNSDAQPLTPAGLKHPCVPHLIQFARIFTDRALIYVTPDEHGNLTFAERSEEMNGETSVGIILLESRLPDARCVCLFPAGHPRVLYKDVSTSKFLDVITNAWTDIFDNQD